MHTLMLAICLSQAEAGSTNWKSGEVLQKRLSCTYETGLFVSVGILKKIKTHKTLSGMEEVMQY